jgi:type III pantothenate kinase
VVIGECRSITHHEPMITLIGLRMVYERNNP